MFTSWHISCFVKTTQPRLVYTVSGTKCDKTPEVYFNIKIQSYQYSIPIIQIGWSWDHLIFVRENKYTWQNGLCTETLFSAPTICLCMIHITSPYLNVLSSTIHPVWLRYDSRYNRLFLLVKLIKLQNINCFMTSIIAVKKSELLFHTCDTFL